VPAALSTSSVSIFNLLKIRANSLIRAIFTGSTPEVADYVDDVYNLIIEAGTHKAPSIKVAEAAKVIENTQRIQCPPTNPGR
jgi:UDP-N-acetyl-D-mannosaminuronate dehydrogenase